MAGTSSTIFIPSTTRLSSKCSKRNYTTKQNIPSLTTFLDITTLTLKKEALGYDIYKSVLLIALTNYYYKLYLCL